MLCKHPKVEVKEVANIFQKNTLSSSDIVSDIIETVLVTVTSERICLLPDRQQLDIYYDDPEGLPANQLR